ncbi:MAG: transglutaminase [Synechococcus sp. Baikal-G1]|nr:MAG: transglutaminase [Synechococcus sp. Baikal-G1]
MLLSIRHHLRYAYDRPVFLEPMTLRLTPKQDCSQQLLVHSLRLDAAPAGSSAIQAADGSGALVCWFLEERDQLEITMEARVRTLRPNPFDWIITFAAAQRLPARYPAAEAAALAAYLDRPLGIGPGAGDGPGAGSVAAWAAGLAVAVEHDTAAFLIELADRIHHDFQHVGRFEGEPMAPEQTLAGRSGACRDTAMLFVAACRSQGLAARFVSGYSIHHPPEVTEHELHAWAEVYLSGAGWRGYDPSLGLAVADGHLVLATAPDHRLAAAVTGTYRGTGVTSTMTYALSVRALEADADQTP